MERTKLTSIRLRTDVLEKIEKAVADHRYWKRSDVINNVLNCVLTNFTPSEVYDMLREYNWRSNVIDCHFKITDQLKPKDQR